MVGYNGSVYKDDFTGYTVQNPFCHRAICAGNRQQQGSTGDDVDAARQSDERRHRHVRRGFAVQEPLHGNSCYSGMRQNEQFLPFSINPVDWRASGGWLATIPTLVHRCPGTEPEWVDQYAAGQQRRHHPDHSDLKTKLSYRYYDYDNQTPQLNVADWAIADAASPQTTGHAQLRAGEHAVVGYIKQNAGAEATWRPVNSVNLGAAYGYEHYDFTRSDASSTAKTPARSTPTGSRLMGHASRKRLLSRSAAPTTMITSAMSACSSGRCRGLLPATKLTGWPIPPITRHPIGNSTSMTATVPRPSSRSTSTCSAI